MKILFLTGIGSGGAAIGALRRARALQSFGCQVEFYAAIVDPLFPARPVIKPLPSNFLYEELLCLHDDIPKIWEQYSVYPRESIRSDVEIFTRPVSIVSFERMRDFFCRFDIIHFNWMAGVLDLDGIHVLRDRPVVWTLSDMNPFTGGCHYSYGCTSYEKTCESCPLVLGFSDQVSASFDAKRSAINSLANLTVVAPSEYLCKKASMSPVFASASIRHIPNPAPLDSFYIINKRAARARMGLDPSQDYILFVSHDLCNPRKGRNLLMKALALVSNRGYRFSLLMYGFNLGTFEQLGFPVVHLNGGNSIDKNVMYAAATLTAFPSSEENSPLVPVESILSGTPVVSFDVGDIARYADAGYVYLARPRCVESFAREIACVLSSGSAAQPSIYLAARRSMQSLFSGEACARGYLSVYGDAIAAKTIKNLFGGESSPCQ